MSSVNVIEWLRSPEGESWSKSFHVPSVNFLVELKPENGEQSIEEREFVWSV